MKNLAFILTVLLFVSACKKHDITIPSSGYPDTQGMKGTIDGEEFNSTSLNATLIYYPNTDRYEFNVNGWRQSTNETLYLRYSSTSFHPGTYRLDFVSGPLRRKTWAYYQKDHNTFYYGDGYVYIYSMTDNVVKGGYDFTIAGNKHIEGKFAIKPNYITENDE